MILPTELYRLVQPLGNVEQKDAALRGMTEAEMRGRYSLTLLYFARLTHPQNPVALSVAPIAESRS